MNEREYKIKALKIVEEIIETLVPIVLIIMLMKD